MKIAILGQYDAHLECLGFLLEIYNNTTNITDVKLDANIPVYKKTIFNGVKNSLSRTNNTYITYERSKITSRRHTRIKRTT